MKIGILSDVHIRGKNPENRIDNFYESIIEKFGEALSIFKKKKCKLILDAGDLFHAPIISLVICDKVVDLIEKNGIPYYTLAGNHAMINGHWENSDASTLAHIFRNNKLLQQCKFYQNNKEKVTVTGYEYYHGIEADISRTLLWNGDLVKSEINIAIIHAMITEKKLPYTALHIPYKEVRTNYDFVITGHNHHEIGLQNVGNTTFIGLGAIARLTAHEKDYTRRPKVAILDTKKGKVEVIELKTAKLYEEVFDIKALDEAKLNEDNLEIFINSLKSTKIQSLDMLGIVSEVGEKSKVDEEVMDEIKKRIGECEDD